MKLIMVFFVVEEFDKEDIPRFRKIPEIDVLSFAILWFSVCPVAFLTICQCFGDITWPARLVKFSQINTRQRTFKSIVHLVFLFASIVYFVYVFFISIFPWGRCFGLYSGPQVGRSSPKNHFCKSYLVLSILLRFGLPCILFLSTSHTSFSSSQYISIPL